MKMKLLWAGTYHQINYELCMFLQELRRKNGFLFIMRNNIPWLQQWEWRC